MQQNQMKLTISLIFIISIFNSFSQVLDKSINSKSELINFYRSRYKTEGLYNKIIDNQGEGFDSLYGLRNMRTILYGIAYRGGANNYFHKTNQRDNKNPLPDDALINLCEEGFSFAIYLYDKNFETADTIKFCQSLFSNNHKFIYSQNILSTQTEIYKILKLVYDVLSTDTLGPIYLHCWNGWHQSGLISAIILRQFCNFTIDEAIDYWKINTDGHKLKTHLIIENAIRKFTPYREFYISQQMQEMICPCNRSF